MQRRRGGFTVVFLAVVGVLASSAAAQPTTMLLVSGQTSLAIIDTDNNGPDGNDCRFFASLGSPIPLGNAITSSLFISSMQTNTPLLRACQLSYDGSASKTADSSSNYVSANITNAMGVNPPASLPIYAELVDETTTPDLGLPVRMNDAADYGQVIDPMAAQAAVCHVCSANGTAVAMLRGTGTPNLLVNLPLYPTAANPTHLKLPGPPAMFELAAGGMQAFNAYVPLTADRHLTLARSDAPTTLLYDLNFNSLPGCASAAPTASGFGVIAVALALLAAGAASLSRRANFVRAVSF